MEPSYVFLGIVSIGALYTIANLNLVLLILFHIAGGICLFTAILAGIAIALLDTGYRLIDPLQNYLVVVAKLCAYLASLI